MFNNKDAERTQKELLTELFFVTNSERTKIIRGLLNSEKVSIAGLSINIQENFLFLVIGAFILQLYSMSFTHNLLLNVSPNMPYAKSFIAFQPSWISLLLFLLVINSPVIVFIKMLPIWVTGEPSQVQVPWYLAYFTVCLIPIINILKARKILYSNKINLKIDRFRGYRNSRKK